MRSSWLSSTLALILLCSGTCVVAADGASSDLGTRDPTQMPPALQQAATPGTAVDAAAETLTQPFFIMSHGGRLTVIHKAHRLHVGDELDNARIVRIDTDAVWLRESGQVKKVAIYPDVIKRPTAPTASSHQRHRRSTAAKKDAP
ncbi:MAG: hypothetical protein EOP36_12185 [Rubrivivax sp.]|nr:MAG: hypothetical protein EOP36_12185 [Rubrivivax sp.]